MTDPRPTTPVLHVMSDLHLAPAGAQCVFSAHTPLVALLDHLTAQPAGSWLVLNGDVFDFLQIPGYDALSLPLAPQRMNTLLDSLDQEPPERNVVQALQRFTQAGHRLSCLPGNHDPELNLSTVQAVLVARLGAETTALPPWTGDWKLQAGGHEVTGLHGHHRDPCNAISSASLLQAQAAGQSTVALPPGSRLVLDVINTYRRASHPDGSKRFSFVDAMPSDVAAALALLMVDPAKAGTLLTKVLGVGTHTLVRAVLQRSGVASARLDSPTRSTTLTAAPDALLEGLTQALAQTLLPQERVASDRWTEDLQAWLDGRARFPRRTHTNTLGAGGLIHTWLLRALAREIKQARLNGALDVPDDLGCAVMASWGQEGVSITGHTHAPKQIRTERGGIYLNTGSWLKAASLPETSEPADIAAWLDLLERNEGSWHEHYPVARVDASGASLLQWDGRALAAWTG